MKEFKSYHPLVNFLYFFTVIGFSAFLMHPLCLIISFFASFTYTALMKGKKAIIFNIKYMLPLMLITALLNPAFNHKGITVITYLPTGNPLTLESIVYGLASAFMLISVIMWFSCFNEIIDSDKLMYLFGKIIPSLSLIFSMTLRFVPLFKRGIKEVASAQKALGNDIGRGNILIRGKNGIKILSVMVTKSLENAIDTSDSMKARGFGLPKRTAYSNFIFAKRDILTIFIILALSSYILFGIFSGKLQFLYFPGFSQVLIAPYNITFYSSYFILFFMPVFLECWEAYKWRTLK